MPELISKFERQYSYKLYYPYKKKSFFILILSSEKLL